MDHERRPGLALRGHRGAQHLLLVVGPGPGGADLADEARAHPGAVHALGEIGDQLARDVVGGPAVHVRRMRGGHVIAGAHDDVEPGGPGHPGERERIPREPAIRRVHEGLAARVLEQQRLVAGRRLVEELEVIEVGAEVVPDPPEVGQAHRLPGQAPLGAVGGLLEHHLEVDQQVLVGQRDPHRLAGDGAEHGLGLSGEAGAWHACAQAGAGTGSAAPPAPPPPRPRPRPPRRRRRRRDRCGASRRRRDLVAGRCLVGLHDPGQPRRPRPRRPRGVTRRPVWPRRGRRPPG